jgi:hypothetical protein
MLNLKTLAVAIVLTGTLQAAMAQNTPPTATPRVDRREAAQDARIRQGVASGQLNARETYRLEKQQQRIHQTEANAKADGKVSAHERRHLKRMQNRASKNIYAQKHDAQKR